MGVIPFRLVIAVQMSRSLSVVGEDERSRDKQKLLPVVPCFFYGYGSVASVTTYPPYRISFPTLVVNRIQELERPHSERLIRWFSILNMGQYINIYYTRG